MVILKRLKLILYVYVSTDRRMEQLERQIDKMKTEVDDANYRMMALQFRVKENHMLISEKSKEIYSLYNEVEQIKIYRKKLIKRILKG